MATFDKRILLVSAFPPPVGGDASWAVEYVEYCRNNDVVVDTVNTSIIGKRADSTNDSWNISDEVKRCFNIWHNIKIKLKEHSDIVHLNINCSPKGVIRDYISSLIIRHSHTPYLVHCHCNVEDQIKDNKVGIFFLRKILKKAERIIVLNEDSFDYVKKIGCSNVLIIPNFIKDENIVDSKIINERVTNVLYVGHVKVTKGIREIGYVARCHPECTFNIVGPILDDFKKEYSLNSMPKNMIFHGNKYEEEVFQFMDEADVYLFPSYTEGFSRSLLEAMSRGLPCIVSDVGANREMIGDKGGIVIPPRDKETTNKAFEDILDVNKRIEMSKNNIEKVKKLYARSSVMNKIFDVYKVIINEHSQQN